MELSTINASPHAKQSPFSYRARVTDLERLLGEDVAEDVDTDAVEHVLDYRFHRYSQVVHADTPLPAAGGVQQRSLLDTETADWKHGVTTFNNCAFLIINSRTSRDTRTLQCYVAESHAYTKYHVLRVAQKVL